MDDFLKLSPTERRLACIQVEEQMRLQAASVEKDFWVCWTLRELFTLPEIGSHLTFKGGTSLSKAWKLTLIWMMANASSSTTLGRSLQPRQAMCVRL